MFFCVYITRYLCQLLIDSIFFFASVWKMIPSWSHIQFISRKTQKTFHDHFLWTISLFFNWKSADGQCHVTNKYNNTIWGWFWFSFLAALWRNIHCYLSTFIYLDAASELRWAVSPIPIQDKYLCDEHRGLSYVWVL